MARSRINPDNIPALIAHKTLIQKTNANFWGYATVNPIVTLADLQRFLTNAYSTLGPVYCLPVVKQIFGVTEFHPAVINAFNINEFGSNYRPTASDIMDEIMRCYNEKKTSIPPVGTGRLYNWWESVFTRDFLSILNDPEAPSEQTPLDLETLKFNKLSIYGIRIRGFTNLLESLRSALSPQNYLSTARQIQGTIESDMRQLYKSIKEKYVDESAIDNLRRMKPKNALKRLSRQCLDLYNALEKYSQEREFIWPNDFLEILLNLSKLLANVAERGPLRSILHTVLLFTDYSSIELGERICLLENEYRERSLEEIVDTFNKFFDSFLERVRNESADPRVPWEQLARLEKTLSSKSFKSLLSSLASASDEDYTGPKPKFLSIGGQVGVNNPQVDEEERSKTESNQEIEEVIDLSRLRNFLQHITFITERSAEILLELSAQNLNIPRSPNALQTITCILTDLSISSSKCSILIHPQESSFLAVHRISDFQMPSELCTQRSAVLNILSSCPVLQDPEIWSLWSYCSNSSLASHWGSLEEFLSDASDEDELREKYDLAIVKLVGHGYIRLSTNGNPRDLISALSRCTSEGAGLDSSAAVKLCDLLIGSILLVNRFIPPSECIYVLSSQLRSLSEDLTWRKLITALLCTIPLPLQAVVFSKIIQPALSENLIALQERMGMENFLKSSSGTPFHDHLVTSIGVVGGLLGWSVWLDAFKKRRLSYSNHQPAIRACSAFEQVETESHKVDILLPTLSNNAECAVDQQDREEVLITSGIFSPETKSENPVEAVTDCQKFIENLRRNEFGLGVDLNSEASDLLKRYESRLNRSLDYLSRQLYGQPGHFILELIQNADDNTYASGVSPSVHFHLSDSELTVRNNEAIGFTQADIAALCDVGLSTKIGSREEKTGRKGIGFKSVFAITSAPEIHSNGFHIRFGCLGDKQQSATILTPEWILDPVDEDQTYWRTCLRLPFSSSTGQGPSSILQYARNLLNHHLLLFLRRIGSIIFQTDQKLSKSLDLRLQRESQEFHTQGGQNPSVLKLITVTEIRDGLLQTSKWLLLRKRFAVDVEKLSKISGSTDSLPNRTDITIAIPLATGGPPPTFSVYAFLPVRNVGFNFLLNADFDLTSSREDIDGTSVWNQFLVNQIPDVFKSLIESVIQIQSSDQFPLSGSGILGRILECLPLNNHNTPASTLSIFACLEDQIRRKLSSVSWIPVLNGTKFANPNNVLLPSQNPTEKSDPSSPESFLFHLLVDRRGMQEIDPAFLLPSISSTNEDEVDLRVRIDIRVQKLNRLGVQRISADALIELASKLSEDELRQPGVLYVLLANIDSSLRSFDSQHFSSLAHRSAWQRRCLRQLRSLRIFPLTDGRLVSLDDGVSSDSEQLRNRNCLMIPPKSPVLSEKTSKISYDEYISLLSHLGPLLSASTIYPPESCNLNPPHMLFSTNDELSLGLAIANSPLDVITKWIVPHQSDFTLENNENADWFIAATCLLAIHGDLSKHEAVISHLPIVCEIEDGIMGLYSPSKHIIFAPLKFLAQLPDQEECEIMSTILENKRSSVLIASFKYFESLDLADEEIQERWQKLFSVVGVSTIQTLIPRKYCMVTDSNISVLPENHPLRNSPALANIPGEEITNVIIEDWDCPGLSDVILPWIEQISTHSATEELVTTVCIKVLSLLNRRWKSNFEKYTNAIGRTTDSKESIVIGTSSWLQNLRTHRWLAVSPLETTGQTMLVAATDNLQSSILPDFISSTIYSPEAFTPTKVPPPIPTSLLSLVCSIWEPLRSLERPPSSDFLNALGVKVKLDESTFKDLVNYLSSQSGNLPNLFTLDSMVQVYRLAQNILKDSPPAILHEIFASAILVPCTNHRSRKRHKVVESLCSTDIDIEKTCPIYCQFCDNRTNENSLKRSYPSRMHFHLVSVDRTCWKAAKLPALESNIISDDCDVDKLIMVPLPSVNFNLSVIPRLDVSENRTELCNIYNDNFKSFFCDVLKVPKTSSLAEVLSMRPSPPKFEIDFQWRSTQEAFGRTLGAWYALIHQCLEVDGDNTHQMYQLRKFPLLYDMNGNWRTPCQKNGKMLSEISEDELVFCWSATDLATMVPRNCVLGHSLDNLSANFNEESSRSISDSHSLLLKVLALPVLEKVVSVNLDTTTASMFSNPSGELSDSLKFFRLLTKVWQSSSSYKTSKATVSDFITAPKVGPEAFLVPALTLRLQISNSAIGWTIKCVSCRFCSGSLLVDSRCEPDLQTGSNEDCVSFLVGDRGSIKEKILIELTRAVFPAHRRSQLLLLNFSIGLLNLRSSLMTSGLSKQKMAAHLRSFFASHGIPSSNPNLNNLLHHLVSETASPAISTLITSSSEKVVTKNVKADSVSVVTAHLESTPSALRRPLLSSGNEEEGVGTYTRYQTPVFEAINTIQRTMLGVSGIPSLRSSLLEQSTLPNSTYVDAIGYEGEKFVYQSFLARIHSLQDFDFPTGHPELGSGRLIKAEWLNSAAESKQPFDIEIYLEVKGSIDRLDSSLRKAISIGVIRQSPGSGDLLHVGPIFVEVKSTCVASSLISDSFKERGDLFEISLAEVSYAQKMDWRFHVMRYRFIRDKKRSEMLHVPNLALALLRDPENFHIYIGMRG
nr:ATP binding region ATPase [Hymenolepis microstoma]